MRFTHVGQQFGLSFERKHQIVTVYKDGVKQNVQSTYPYTKVTLSRYPTGGTVEIIATASVGCVPTDRYDPKLGRKFALNALSRVLKNKVRKNDEDAKAAAYKFREAMWKAYFEFVKPQAPKEQKPADLTLPVLDGTVVKREEVKLLPPGPVDLQ